ncbi:MAG: hypothetical protein DMG68_06410, partial [Acidobacteria bacterium]
MLRRILISFLLLPLSLAAHAQKERHFTFHYSFTVKNVSQGKLLRVWIPLAHSDASQDIRITDQQSDLALKRTQETEYGNWMLYAEAAKAEKSEYHFSVDYDVVRREHVVLVHGKAANDSGTDDKTRLQLARFLQPDKLVPITGLPAQLAADRTKGATT